MLRVAAGYLRLLRSKLSHFAKDVRRPPGGPAGRTRRRIVLIGTAVGVITLLLSIPGKVTAVVAGACGLQGTVSDFCAGIGVPGLPTGEERRAWNERQPGNCAALDAHIDRFPKGIYRQAASELLQRRRSVRADRPHIRHEEVSGYVRQSTTPAEGEAEAIDLARKAAASDADTFCRDRGPNLVGVRLLSVVPACVTVARGSVCGAQYRAQCAYSEYAINHRCD